ncbi:hypothetical protein ACHHYP_05944 [Achlya hypogyna]|uniref:D-glutamate cyclase-like C-terminal domain-containing protein n=1 Tax=Achlya hypogyna TaxID=1202772 RepID=A0A1V9YVT4_ACHHY|nr:hypothetical protein ACHHYP_05944 [Achlya hypogyna]
MDAILSLVHHDIGGRGMTHLLDGPRDRAHFSEAIEALSRLPPGSDVAILTGFPCLLDYTPPTETDGLGGACALIHALHVIGRHRAHILTDEVNAVVLKSCIEAAAVAATVLHSFPPANEWTHATQVKLEALYSTMGAYVAIERAGAAEDGRYYTMRARDMTAIVAPLDQCFAYAKSHGIPTIAIGDGGNELGMGNVSAATKAKVRNGETIAAKLGCDHLIVACISDWGAYALCAGLALRHRNSDALLTRETVVAIANAMIAAGARDGILGCQDTFVDGLPLVETLNLVHAMRHCVNNMPLVTRLVGKTGSHEWPTQGFHIDSRSPQTAWSQPHIQFVKARDLASLPSPVFAERYLAVELSIQQLDELEMALMASPLPIFLFNLRVGSDDAATNINATIARLRSSHKEAHIGLAGVSLDVLQAVHTSAPCSIDVVTQSRQQDLLQVATFCQRNGIAMMLEHAAADTADLQTYRNDRTLYFVDTHIATHAA